MTGQALYGSLADLIALLSRGGPVVAILLTMSVIALTIFLVKIWQFRHMGGKDRKACENALFLMRNGRAGPAADSLMGAKGPAGILVWHAIQGRRLAAPDALVREEIERLGLTLIARFRSWMKPLEIIAALAPLLGLFGTVLGMIEAFRQMEAAGAQVNPSVLSGGIWEALLTTAFGLAVAIPALIALNWLERRIDRSAQEMDDLVTRVFTGDLAAARIEELMDAEPTVSPIRLR